jgi:hypothetical protein
MTAAQDEVKAATQTCVYGYPLVYSMDELVDGKTPYNQFGFARNLMTPRPSSSHPTTTRCT